MGSTIALAAYEVRVKHPKTGEYEQIHKFGPNWDLFHLFEEWLQSLLTEVDMNEEEQHAFCRREHDYHVSGRAIWGTLESGNWGEERSLFNSRTGRVAGLVSKDHAVLGRFFFRIDCPRDCTRGIVLLQRTGVTGIQEHFKDRFLGFLKEKMVDYRIEINPLIHRQVIEKFAKSPNINKIRFQIYEIPPRVHQIFDGDFNPKDAYMEVIIKSKRKKFLNLGRIAKKWYKNSDEIRGVAIIQDAPCDNVKIEVKEGRQTRTIDAGDWSKFRPAVDITDKILRGDDGHPALSSISQVAAELAGDFASQLGIVLEDG